jgi:hypothetical protein
VLGGTALVAVAGVVYAWMLANNLAFGDMQSPITGVSEMDSDTPPVPADGTIQHPYSTDNNPDYYSKCPSTGGPHLWQYPDKGVYFSEGRYGLYLDYNAAVCFYCKQAIVG